MFKKIEALKSDVHQHLRFSPSHSFAFAAAATSAPLAASEFFPAARHYAIVFPLEETAPVALFALHQGVNLYVGSDGTWKAPYVPAHIRRYPFILASTNAASTSDGDAEEQHVVCIDTAAPHFAAGQGDPLFTADGELAGITQEAIRFLQNFQQELLTTQRVCRELDAHGVLVEKKVNIEKDGATSTIGGIRCVDTEKLNALEDAVLAAWVRNGLMGLIHSHLNSLVNLRALA